jgi:RNA polymerase sigma factor (sigma-70 family)
MGAAVRKMVTPVETVLARDGRRLRACAAKHGVPADQEDDVVQEAAVKAMQRDDLSDEETATHVLLALIKWESQTAITRHARLREDLHADAADIPQEPANGDLEMVLANRELVRRAIPFLSGIYRKVVERLIYDHENVREIADALGIPKDEAHTRLSRARVKLREIIDGLEREDLASCAAAVSLLALLALFENRSFADVGDMPSPRPDAWIPAAPAPGSSRAPLGWEARGPVPYPRSANGAGSGSTALASLGLIAAAAAFMLLGDVPLAPAASARVLVESQAIIAAEPSAGSAQQQPASPAEHTPPALGVQAVDARARRGAKHLLKQDIRLFVAPRGRGAGE